MKNNGNPIEFNHAKRCVVCNTILIGKQSLYCSRKCHNQNGNKKHQNYISQQNRGLERKIQLINDHGGKCTKCGYKSNLAALTFHHKNPSEKLFPLDLRNCSNNNWNNLLLESQKCELLCIRCHVELHNPNLFV